jgi:hypothetical protein
MPPEFVEHSAQLPFSGVSQGVRIPNPDIAGGHIALIAQNNNPVQEPPFALDRMHASRQKQIAFNRRVLKTEEEEEKHALFVYVGVGHTMSVTQINTFTWSAPTGVRDCTGQWGTQPVGG